MDFERRSSLPPNPIDPLLRRTPAAAGPPPPRPAARRRRRSRRTSRLDATVVALASALGLWLGFGAASVSPVTPIPATVTRPLEVGP